MKFLIRLVLCVVAVIPMKALAIYQPEYVVLETLDELEVRAYPEMVVARTRVEADFEDAGNMAFRRLAGYIFGDNEADQKISMTAPVMMEPEADNNGVYWISFVMPGDFALADLPAPVSDLVEVTRVPAMQVAVVTYRGGWSQEKYDHNRERLRALLVNTDWKVVGEPVWARYNSPFRPAFMRTNEVMLPVENRGNETSVTSVRRSGH